MSVTIDARPAWVDTGLLIVPGTTYLFTASGRWKDARIETDADGYPSANIFQQATERLRRVPEARWFALIGAVDRQPSTQFVIGSRATFRAATGGQLTCFANDLRWFYFNNSGSVTLTMEVVSGPR